jgi:hypothetical protein
MNGIDFFLAEREKAVKAKENQDGPQFRGYNNTSDTVGRWSSPTESIASSADGVAYRILSIYTETGFHRSWFRSLPDATMLVLVWANRRRPEEEVLDAIAVCLSNEPFTHMLRIPA